MKIVVSQTKSQIITDNPKLLDALVNLYSVIYPGARFSSAYKKRNWDGKKKFITDNGVFPTGLLPRILESLDKIDCNPELDIQFRDEDIAYVSNLLSPLTLYPDQELLIRKCLDQKRGIVKAPTGMGKSVCIAYLLKLLENKKCMVITQSKQLVIQLYKFFTEKCKISDVGICFGGGFELADKMVVCAGSIHKVLDQVESADAVFFDEVHEFCKGKTSIAIINSFPNAKIRLGFTATVPSDKMSLYTLEGALGPIMEGESTKSLADKGRIATPRIYIKKFIHEEYASSEYSEIYSEGIINNKRRNELIASLVRNILDKKKNAKILILVKNLQHLENLKDLIPGLITVQGSDDISSRYDKISKFVSDGCVIAGTEVMQTGISIDEITDLINARALKSEIATIQALGRALRITDDKKEVDIYDIKDNAKYLSTHAVLRVQSYKKEGHEIHEIT